MRGDPADLDFEEQAPRRVRGPNRTPKRSPKRREATGTVERYRSPTYCDRIQGDVVAELPEAMPTPKRPGKPTIMCAGIPGHPCKTIIDPGRNRVRCRPCSADMNSYRIRERGRAARAAKKAKEQE